jgi:multidrug efflux pump subunit AcrA (membrane-fusion protein)
LENRDLVAGAQESRGAYAQAEATYTTTTSSGVPEELQKAELDANAAKQNLDAQQKLYNSRQNLFQQGALPRKELDQAGVALTQARNQYEIAQKHLNSLRSIGKAQELKSAAGQLTSAKGKYLGAEAQLSYSEIRSPIDGVVTDRPLYPGEMATAGTPLLTIMDLSQVIAKAHVSQSDAALLRVGNPATIAVPAETQQMTGKVSLISPALDPNSTTVEIWVQAPNPGERLKPGSSVKLSIVAQIIPDALIIPANALLTDAQGNASVMLIGSDTRAHQREVRAGVRQGDVVQIVDGLKPGDRVVTTAAYGLPDNTKVRLQASADQPTSNNANDSSKSPKPAEKD